MHTFVFVLFRSCKATPRPRLSTGSVFEKLGHNNKRNRSINMREGRAGAAGGGRALSGMLKTIHMGKIVVKHFT